ncbi:MAG: hypothetical protein HUU41_13015 [Bryobacteraceae bacterium]|nr:hypothetical protein [Bryobacteraceae bacterium]
MSKLTGSPFGRPNRPADPSRFVEEGTAALRPAPEPLPAPSPQPQSPPAPGAATDPGRRAVSSYKHKEINHLRLKRLSQNLDRNMGDMLDEALEAKFAEWLSRVPPPEPLF